MTRLLIASPHRYPDLARLWHRSVMRELTPAFESLHLEVEVYIFCDANADRFDPRLFPGVRFTRSGPGMRDFMEFYDATLNAPCDFVLFLDADTFVLDGDWASSYFPAFEDANVAAVSYVPRRETPAIFALLCRTQSYRSLPPPALACRFEFPQNWPDGVNLQPGDHAARELAKRGQTIVNIGADESSRHTVNFRGTTGIRALREHVTRACRNGVYLDFVRENPALLAAAYDNVLLGCLYEALYGETFAPDTAGSPLGGSLTLAELRMILDGVRDRNQLDSLRGKFEQSRQNILRMAAREGVELAVEQLL
ncbi:MAG TPA: hypothetical protein VGJ21_10750 [Terracidiphilus sp.]|jgi:hypothetical protein